MKNYGLMMNILVQAPFQVSDELQGLIEEKVGKLPTFFERIHTATVFLKEEENRRQTSNGKTLEIRLEVPGHSLYADASADSYERALADAYDKMRRQIKKYKQQMAGH